ncbi:hypothetical protein FPRO06_01758 [Fusarium proliferatum]|nr:hypothetical protein FPRO06_01758 [Fusarium proliferatum]
MSGGRASSFQPFGQRFKGKNTLVFYPEGSPTFAGALSQDMDISHRIEVCDTPAPSIVELGNYITIKSRSGTDHASPTHRTSKSPFSTSSPTHWVTPLPRHTGGPPLRTSAVPKHVAGRDVRTTIMLRNIPNKDGQPPSAQIVGASLGRPDCLFRLRRVSVGPGPRGPHEERLARVQRVEGTEHRTERSFSNTTNFGVTPEEARELHQSQKAYDAAKATAAPDGGGIWDGGASKDDLSDLI